MSERAFGGKPSGASRRGLLSEYSVMLCMASYAATAYQDAVVSVSEIIMWCDVGQGRIVGIENSGKRRGVGGEIARSCAGCLFFAWPAPRGNLASARRRLKELLGGKRFRGNDELHLAINNWLNGPIADDYDNGILKLVNRYIWQMLK
ncbi:hypothetical protein X777_16090 [Ooceraea biroi]|uniref:Uncharacterized protein n=1 Tax=Ooceraea biroi TaxID=2015173 RepID=A0A026WV42_OOCBI|nr:hypothetical protein X777_16090 [Ooceraea biroi]